MHDSLRASSASSRERRHATSIGCSALVTGDVARVDIAHAVAHHAIHDRAIRLASALRAPEWRAAHPVTHLRRESSGAGSGSSSGIENGVPSGNAAGALQTQLADREQFALDGSSVNPHE
jgi:hypothetical protein